MIGILKTGLGYVRASIQRRNTLNELRALTDAQLRDIGVDRGSIEMLVGSPISEQSGSGVDVRLKARAFA